jgi:hypothetical protein
MTTFPESGVVRPATQSSSVVFPAPDGPKMIVIPGAMAEVMSSVKSLPVLGKRLRNCTVSTFWDAELLNELPVLVLFVLVCLDRKDLNHLSTSLKAGSGHEGSQRKTFGG